MFDLYLAMDASKNPDNYERGDLYRATVMLGAEVESLRAAVERVRALCESKRDEEDGKWAGALWPTEVLRALDGEA